MLMNKAKIISAAIVALLFMAYADLSAQATGFIRGRVVDSSTGEPVFGAAVMIKSIEQFSQTDLDGKYELRVPAGEYEVIIQMMGFETQTKRVTVTAGRETPLSVALSYPTLNVVTVRERAMNNTQASMLALQRKSASVSDGVSQEAIKKSPDSSAGDVLKRITGITLVDGRFVFVRGLGERYSNTLLDGSLLPSPEPDKRVVPLDIFPASLIKNIQISKTFLPEDPGEFSGGLVKIETQDYPDEFLLTVGAGLGSNNQTTGKPFQTYRGGKMDRYGYDDGFRDKPALAASLPETMPLVPGNRFGGLSPEIVQLTGASFPNNWGTQTINAPYDRDYKFSIGDLFKFGEMKFGYILGSSYGMKFQTKTETETKYSASPMVKDLRQTSLLRPLQFQVSEKYNENVLWGNSLNLTFEPKKGQRISSKSLLSLNSDKYVRNGYGQVPVDTVEYVNTTTGFISRSITSQIFEGEHALNLTQNVRPHKITWLASYALASRDEPDLKQALWTRKQGSGEPFLTLGSSPDGTRYYSESFDTVRTWQAAYELPFQQWDNLPAKLKLGIMTSDRSKNFDSSTYRLAFNYLKAKDESDIYPVPRDFTFHPLNILADKWWFKQEVGGYDFFDAEQFVRAHFIQADLPLFGGLRFAGGVRQEEGEQKTVTYDPFHPETRNEIQKYGQETLKKTDRLPSINLIYDAGNDMNLRFAYSETITRPDLRELSSYGFTPHFGGDRIFGNPQLDRTYIHNYDARWEWYMSPEEYLGTGIFIKNMSNPIETIGFPVTSTGNRNYSYENAKMADVKGLEFELRKEFLERFFLEANLFFIRSAVEVMSYEELLAIRMKLVDPLSRRAAYNPTNLERSLQGQSDVVYNVRLSYYLDRAKKSTIGVYYNYFGDRIESVGTEMQPDTYEKGAGVWDVVFTSKTDNGWDIKAAAKNVTNTEYSVTQKSELTGSESIVKSYTTETTYTLSANWKY